MIYTVRGTWHFALYTQLHSTIQNWKCAQVKAITLSRNKSTSRYLRLPWQVLYPKKSETTSMKIRDFSFAMKTAFAQWNKSKCAHIARQRFIIYNRTMSFLEFHASRPSPDIKRSRWGKRVTIQRKGYRSIWRTTCCNFQKDCTWQAERFFSARTIYKFITRNKLSLVSVLTPRLLSINNHRIK